MSGDQLVRIGGRRLRVTNLEKVLYPETGTTKGEVIDYVTRIAPVMLPHLAGRPVTRLRWPDGVGTDTHPESSFFAKDLEPGAPEWIRRVPIEHSSGAKHYPVLSEVGGLVYLAQVASLELHVPQWRFTPDGARSAPDRLVLDLDPGPGVGLAECAEVARWAREILQGMGLEPFPVTSGSKGIHLYATLSTDRSSDDVTAVARELARAIEADHPDLVVSAMSKSVRDGRVFIDWSQNNGSKTTIAPYSLRGRAQPTVAAPRTWAELDDPALQQLLFTEVLARADANADLLAGLDRQGDDSDEGPLATYIAKRTAGKTPEPVPARAVADPGASTEAPRFVIQEHHASRLHWDLRLEHEGVFVSWAVPRGIPATAERNHLAVMTENHPLDYGSFEGEIPRGEYGAGTVTIWDDGHYELEKWRDSEIIFTLRGHRQGPLCDGRFALIRTDGAGEKSTWLLHRMKNGTKARNRAIDRPAESRPDTSPTPPASSRAPMLATGTTAGIARESARRWATDGTAWVEAKWDGIRAVGVWDGARLRLVSRNGNDLTATYPELTESDIGLGPSPAVIDGEIVALDADARPSFSRLQARMNLSRPRDIERERIRTPVTYFVFDILSSAEVSTVDKPLTARREILERLTARVDPRLLVPPVFDDMDAALQAAHELDLEGIMVKNPASPYRGGVRSTDWLKVKFSRTQEVVIGGIRPGRNGRSAPIGSLLVGIPDDDGLRYAGRVGSGLGEAVLRRLAELLEPLRTDENPFVGVPKADASDALWVRPQFVAEVEFAEFTPGGILRQARWRGLRPDKAPDEVTRDG